MRGRACAALLAAVLTVTVGVAQTNGGDPRYNLELAPNVVYFGPMPGAPSPDIWAMVAVGEPVIGGAGGRPAPVPLAKFHHPANGVAGVNLHSLLALVYFHGPAPLTTSLSFTPDVPGNIRLENVSIMPNSTCIVELTGTLGYVRSGGPISPIPTVWNLVSEAPGAHVHMVCLVVRVEIAGG